MASTCERKRNLIARDKVFEITILHSHLLRFRRVRFHHLLDPIMKVLPVQIPKFPFWRGAFRCRTVPPMGIFTSLNSGGNVLAIVFVGYHTHKARKSWKVR